MKQILDDKNLSNQENLAMENIISSINMTEDLKIEDYIDSDNDGIPDEWEINGYTVENGLIVPWDEKKHSKLGLIKYVSDPYDSHTAGGPYSDNEKVLGKIEGLEEAMHPLVASYPKINVEMEKIILSKNINISKEESKTSSEEKSNTVGLSTSNSHTDSTTVGTSVTTEAHASLTDIGGSVSVTANFSNESSNTVTTEKSSSVTGSESLGATITKSLSLNQSEVALLNGNIRYINVGTMPIYNLKPTLNFVLGLGKEADTIATISAKSNTLAKVVLPNQKYPVTSQNSVSWNTSDDFNSQPIKLNYDQVIDLVQWKALQIQTTQIEGEYKKYDFGGEQYVSENFKWEYILPDIYRKTALIVISFSNGQTFERRIAANKFKDSKRKIPHLNLKEAIEMAFAGAKIENNEIHYKNICLKKNNLHIVVDQVTNSIIAEQNQKNFFDVIITKEMKIMFLEEDQEKNIEIFKQIEIKLKHFNGKNYNHYLDLKNEITFDMNLGENGEILSQIIKKYLLSQDISLKVVDKLIINWSYGFGGHKNFTSLREDHWNITNPETWYKSISIEYNNLKIETFPLYFRNILFDKTDDIKEVLKKMVEELKYFDGRDEDHRFDLNYVIHLTTDLGSEWKYLKEIIKTYLLVKGLFSSSIVKYIDISLDTTKGNSLQADGFTIIDKSNWYKNISIKYHNEWESEKFKLYFKNIRLIDDWINLVGSFIEGFENYFKNFPKSVVDELAKTQKIAAVFGMLSKM